MKKEHLYITDKNWFESTSLKNPITFTDIHLKKYYPEFYNLDYDLKILSAKAPDNAEKSFPIYNDYLDKFGCSDVSCIDSAVSSAESKNVFLNGFNQKQFEYIAPLIKDSAEVIYFFKCIKIKDLSALSQFKKLKCVLIYGNNSVESLWDMSENKNLHVLSFVYITKLKHIETLVASHVEYINFDSSDNNGNKKEMLFDDSIFKKTPTLRNLFLTYKK